MSGKHLTPEAALVASIVSAIQAQPGSYEEQQRREMMDSAHAREIQRERQQEAPPSPAGPDLPAVTSSSHLTEAQASEPVPPSLAAYPPVQIATMRRIAARHGITLAEYAERAAQNPPASEIAARARRGW